MADVPYWAIPVAGYAVFANDLLNQQFSRILTHWSRFLTSSDSRYVLIEPPHPLDDETMIVPWLGDEACGQMDHLVQSALGPQPNPTPGTFAEIFTCDPSDPYYGFSSWDDFNVPLATVS